MMLVILMIFTSMKLSFDMRGHVARWLSGVRVIPFPRWNDLHPDSAIRPRNGRAVPFSVWRMGQLKV